MAASDHENSSATVKRQIANSREDPNLKHQTSEKREVTRSKLRAPNFREVPSTKIQIPSSIFPVENSDANESGTGSPAFSRRGGTSRGSITSCARGDSRVLFDVIDGIIII